MPKLVVNIGPMPRQLTLSQFEVLCSLTDELRFSAYVGQDVLLAHSLTRGAPLVVFAMAKLDRFTSSNGTTSAILINLQILPDEIELPDSVPHSVFWVLHETDGALTSNPGSRPEGNQEAFSAFVPQPAPPIEIYGQIGLQVRTMAQGRCALSGVAVSRGDGVATPIRPVASGGEIHVRNFIFLHDEPAHLFNSFAWTIGPDFEIIVDAWAMGTSVMSTVNRSGKLLVGDDRFQWLDETALAWHRQTFFERLR